MATPAAALPCPEVVDHGPQVACGSDYFQTVAPGTFDTITIGGVPTVVNFTGVPFGPGLTDTIVQRTTDIPINGVPSAPNLRITALQLVSTNLAIPIFVSLAPNSTGGQDLGTMTISSPP